MVEIILHTFLSNRNNRAVPTTVFSNKQTKNTMNTSLRNTEAQQNHLKVVKNSAKRKSVVLKKHYINTLVPNFNYINEKGKIVVPKKCAY